MNKDRFGILEIGDNVPVVSPNTQVFGAETGLQVRPDSVAKQDANGIWKNAIGLESSATHRHVAKVWQDKCTPMSDALSVVRNQHEGKFDKVVLESEVRLASYDRLTDGTAINADGLESLRTFTPIPSTTVSYLVNAGFETDIPKYFNAELTKRENDWSNGERDRDARNFRLRLRQEGDAPVVRAVCSGRYGVLDNLDALEFIADALPSGSNLNDALASHFFNNGDDIQGNILLPDYIKQQPDSDYGVGISFRNSEIRNGAFKISPFLFRAICLNGMIWGRRNSEIAINQKHLGTIDKDNIRLQVREAVILALSEGNDILTLMNLTQQVKVKNVQQVIAKVARDNKMTIEQGRAWSQGYLETLQEPSGDLAHETAFGLVNGLTRGAQAFSGVLREQMETTASIILAPSIDADLKAIQKRWGTLSDSASSLPENIVAKYQMVGV